MVRILAVFLLAAPTHAHDLWLIPSEKAAVKEHAVILAHQGMEFPNSTNAPNVKLATKTFVIGPDGAESNLLVLGSEGKSGRLGFTPSKAGLHSIALETSPKQIEMEADEFNAYLISDGMPNLFKLRHKDGTLNKPAKEQYRKSVKAIVRVGTSDAGEISKPLELPLEIVPLSNPLTRKVGETLAVRVLFLSKPLADANLGWTYPGDGDSPRGTVRTNAKGEALIPVGQSGLMAVRLTHMTRPKDRGFEWESFWTTLTFRIDE